MTDQEPREAESVSELEPLPTRPGWPKPVGIISIVLGSLAVVCGMGGVAMMPISASMMGQAFEDIPPPPSMTLSPEIIASLGISTVVNLLLIVAGVMTIRRSGLGRTLHLVYALGGVVAAFIGVWIQMRLQTQVDEWIKQYGDTEIPNGGGMTWGQQMEQGQAFQGIGMAVGLVLSLAYPVFCIIWFGMVKRDADAIGANIPDEEPLY